MAMLIQAGDAARADAAGGKAAALSRLAAMGFAPPDFFVIPAAAFRGTPDGVGALPGLAEEVAQALEALGPGPFAVRSSGRDEDGARHSHAGQFDSFLNVAASEVIAAARKVWASGASSRVAIYRNIESAALFPRSQRRTSPARFRSPHPRSRRRDNV